MKILIAADKFKGSLSSEAACNSIAAGIRQVDASVDVMEVFLFLNVLFIILKKKLCLVGLII